MAGISNDHTEAAVITPAAMPEKQRFTSCESGLRTKKTNADPAAVPSSGIKAASRILFIADPPFITEAGSPQNRLKRKAAPAEKLLSVYQRKDILPTDMNGSYNTFACRMADY